MNCIGKVAEILRIRVGERFKIRDNKNELDGVFYLDDKGLQSDDCDVNPDIYTALLNGKYKIIKLPSSLRRGDKYYTYYVDFRDSIWVVQQLTWYDSVSDYANLKCGIVFRSRREAKKMLPIKYKELTGKDFLEKYRELTGKEYE